MLKSLLLAALILALALLSAWAVVHFGRKHGERPGKLRKIAIAFVVGGIAFSAYAFWMDYGQRQVTLFEVLLPGSEGESGPVVRTAEFTFEHPGVEHSLTVLPKAKFAREATRPVSATVVLRTVDGETLIRERVTFGIEYETSRTGVVRPVWGSRDWTLRPERAVGAVLSITLEDPGIHEILVRVEDPEKRDGERAPDY